MHLCIYGKAIFRTTLVGSFFILKNAGCVSTMLLQELCHRLFSGNFPKFFGIATFQNSE